jgi:hypothetical protein
MKILISLDYIKKSYPILNYVEESEIMPYVKMAQDTYVDNLIGSYLMDRLTGTASLSTTETELKDYYVKPTLLHYTIYLYGRDINFKFTNRGISKQFTDNSDYAELDEVIYKANGQKDVAENYGNRLLKFISENKNNLGLNEISYSDGPAKTSFNFGGIYVPTDRPKTYSSRQNDI